MKLNQYQLITTGLLALTACSGLALTSTHIYADDNYTDTTNITVPESCSMTGTVNTAHTATLNPGTWSGDSGSQFENGIGKTTLTTFCNDNNGFSIYAIGYTDDTYGATSLKGTNTNIEIPTKVYESADTTSNWSMKVTKVENPQSGDPVTYNPDNMTISNSFSSWHVVPTDYTRVAEYHAQSGTSTTDKTLGAKVETTYAAYISQTQPADTYTGKVKYVMVHPYSADPDPYKPTTAVYMQDVATWKNTLLPNIGDEIIATDARDGKKYYVAKLPDGNIWMTQNLDHDIDSSYNYNSTNTDIPANWDDTLTSTYSTGNNTWSDPNTGVAVPNSYDPGNRCWNGVLDSDASGSTTIDTGTVACSSITTTPNHYHIGNYYNWTAAVAMENSSEYEDDETDVNQSICPAGWMLPKGGYTQTGSGSFYNLIDNRYTAGTSGNIQLSPVYFTYGGSWTGASDAVGWYGIYLSSVVSYWNYSYSLSFYADDSTYPQSDPNRASGYSVRCLVR